MHYFVGYVIVGEMIVSKQFSFRFDDTLYAKTKIIAQNETRSISNLIQHLCQKKVEAYEAQYGGIQLSDEDLSDQ